MPYTCNFCGWNHCSKHRMPESHDCPNKDKATNLGPEMRGTRQQKSKGSYVNRRTVLAGVLVSGIAGGGYLVGAGGLDTDPIANITSGALESAAGPDTDEIKENAETVGYNQLYRNISQYEGEAVYYENANISDVVEATGRTKEYIVTLDGHGLTTDKVLYCLWDGDPFRDGDDINLWGVVQGMRTYSSLLGENTVPEIDLVDLELA